MNDGDTWCFFHVSRVLLSLSSDPIWKTRSLTMTVDVFGKVVVVDLSYTCIKYTWSRPKYDRQAIKCIQLDVKNIPALRIGGNISNALEDVMHNIDSMYVEKHFQYNRNNAWWNAIKRSGLNIAILHLFKTMFTFDVTLLLSFLWPVQLWTASISWCKRKYKM